MNLALQKLHILKACAYICYFKLQTLSVIVHGRKIQLYALTVFFLLLLQVNKTHHSEDEMPQVSFFTGRNKASCSTVDLPSSSSAQSSTKETTFNSISEKVTLSLDTPPCEHQHPRGGSYFIASKVIVLNYNFTTGDICGFG